MIIISFHRRYNISQDAMWEKVGDFFALHTWLPAVVETRHLPESPGTRIAVLPDGGEVLERLVESGPYHHRYVVDGGPMPVKEFDALLQVESSGPNACDVRWRAHFTAAGLAEPEAAAIVEQVFTAGLDALECDG